jgi:hypothetical protein
MARLDRAIHAFTAARRFFQSEEVTFLKKSNQKTFGPAGLGTTVANAPMDQKFFASFL